LLILDPLQPLLVEQRLDKTRRRDRENVSGPCGFAPPRAVCLNVDPGILGAREKPCIGFIFRYPTRVTAVGNTPSFAETSSAAQLCNRVRANATREPEDG
jgi:hypothetical protein